ncbi:MAG TPA: hypothetical protein VHB77_04240 [Planctomycetaceae bacterium]|nr:hypothetical protein [Planctomycetaceae bacterium]
MADAKTFMIGGVVLAAAGFGLKYWSDHKQPVQTPPQPAFNDQANAGTNNNPSPQANTTTPQQGTVQQWQPRPVPVAPMQSHAQPNPTMSPDNTAMINPGNTNITPTKTLKWDVVVDPPIEPVVYSDLDKLKIQMPERTGERDILFPEGYSAYLALGNDRQAKGSRVVWDLRDDKKRAGAALNIQVGNNPVALSSNGAFLALYTIEVRQTMAAPAAPAFRGISAPSVQTQQVSVIAVHNVAAKKPLRSLTMSSSNSSTMGGGSMGSSPRPALLAFCGDQYLLASTDDGSTTVWEMPSGQMLRTFQLPNMRDAVASSSPGGRYLAVARGSVGGNSAMMSSDPSNSETLRVYDILGGQLMGEAPLSTRGMCVGLGFSPDGEEIAVLTRESRGSKLTVISVNDGSVALELELPRVSVPTSTNSNGPALQWFPNRERWLLFGQSLLSRESGEVSRLPSEKGVAPTGLVRVLDDAHVLRVFENKGKCTLKPVAIAGGDAGADE